MSTKSMSIHPPSEGFELDFKLRRMMSRYAERRSSRASTTTVLPDYETSQRNRELPPIPTPLPQIPPMPPLPPLPVQPLFASPPRPSVASPVRRGTVSGTGSGSASASGRPPQYAERSRGGGVGQGSTSRSGSSSAPSVVPPTISAPTPIDDVLDISRESAQRLHRARTLHSARSVPAIRIASRSEESYNANTSQTTLSSSVVHSPLTPLRLERSDPPAYVPPTPPVPLPLPLRGSVTRYTFATLSSNSMVLHPPPAESETPLYHISVSMNCFNPLVHTTTVKRGGGDGENVGSFEMGISTKPSRIRFRGKQFLTKDVLEAQHHNGYRHNGWFWDLKQPNSTALVWTFVASTEKALVRTLPPSSLHKPTVKQCRLNDNARTLVAEYIVPDDGDEDFAKRELDVHGPMGARYLDEIVLSVLVIERRRLMPDGNVKRGLNS